MTEFLLGEICEFINGGAWSDKEYVDTGIPVLKVSNCKPSGFVIDEINYLPFESEEKYQRNKLKVGDVIIATVGSHPNLVDSAAGRTCIVTHLVEGFLLNQNAVCVRTGNPDILDQSYLGYFSKTQEFQHYIQMKGRGAANQMRIAIGSIKEFRIKLPPIEVQKKIAVFLSRYDELLENNQKQIKLLEETAQRLYKEWFVDLHFPGYENTPVADGVPEGWKRVSLSEIAPIKTGKKDANFGTDDGQYPFFTCAQEPIKAPDYSFDCSAVILAGNGDFNVKVYRGKFEAYQRTYVFSPYNVDNLYTLYYSVVENMRQLFQGASGSTIKFLTKGMLEAIQVIVPSESVLEQFNNNCEAIQRKIEALKQQNQFVTEVRDRLLPKLMNGEIEV